MEISTGTQREERNATAVSYISIHTHTFNAHLLHLHFKLAFCWTQSEGVTEQQVTFVFKTTEMETDLATEAFITNIQNQLQKRWLQKTPNNPHNSRHLGTNSMNLVFVLYIKKNY